MHEEVSLKPITLRNLPEPVARAVRERAARYRVSLNKAVTELLEQAVVPGPARGPERYHDMDRIFGSLSPKEADALERALKEMRRSDKELWE
jgi:plasmid stability protein